jgi:hypothetical protein
MGYTVRFFAPAEIQRGALEAERPDWVLISAGGHPMADRAYLEEVRAGGHGYEVAHRAVGGRPLPRWLETRLKPGAVSPEVWILRRRDASVGAATPEPQRPGTPNR